MKDLRRSSNSTRAGDPSAPWTPGATEADPISVRLSARNMWLKRALPGDAVMRASNVQRRLFTLQWARNKKFGEPLSGDVKVVSTDAPTVAKAVGALISGLPFAQREATLYRALRFAQGSKGPVVPWIAVIPDNADCDMARRIINGAGLTTIALGACEGGDPVSKVLSTAASYSSRKPIAGDPLQPSSLNEVSLAQLLLQAFAVSPELKDKLGASPEVVQALKGLAEDDIVAAAEVEAIADSEDDNAAFNKFAYDCAKHSEPLGGVPLQGGGLKSWIKKGVGAIKDLVNGEVDQVTADAVIDHVVERRAELSTKLFSKPYAELNDEERSRVNSIVIDEAGTKYGADRVAKIFSDNPATSSAGPSETPTLSEAVASTTADAKAALQAAIDQINANKESAQQLKDKAEEESLKVARLAWAQALLEVPDDVAEILSKVSPNLSDPSGLLTSSLSLLPAAKATGKVGTVNALVSAIRAAMSKGSVSDSVIYNMLSGDPSERSMEDDAVDLFNS